MLVVQLRAPGKIRDDIRQIPQIGLHAGLPVPAPVIPVQAVDIADLGLTDGTDRVLAGKGLEIHFSCPVLLLIFQGRPELRLIQFPVDPVCPEQLFMTSLLADPAAAHDQDPVRLQDGGETVRDDDTGPPLHQDVDSLLDGIFRNGIQGGGGLVQYEDLGIFQDHAGDTQALFLSPGELEAAVADDRVISVRLRHDKVMDTGDPAGRLNLLHGCLLIGHTKVLQDRSVEQIGLLCDHADLAAQPGQVKVPDIHPGDADSPAFHIVQPGDQVHQRGLSGSGRPDDRIHPSARNCKAHI